MRKNISSIILLLVSVAAIANDTTSTRAVLSGNIHIGTNLQNSQEQETTDLTYQTLDPRLGTNSGNRYLSNAHTHSFDSQLTYGTLLNVALRNHRLFFTLEGQHDWDQQTGSLTETIFNQQATLLSQISQTKLQPIDKTHNIHAGIQYTYNLNRPGESLTAGYHYRWNNQTISQEYKVEDHVGWNQYTTNTIYQQIANQQHHAFIDYVRPIAKGHAIDVGIMYNRRQIDAFTLQAYDQQQLLNAQYQHLTQYGALYARYRLTLGPVKASVALEYRATKMQQRWMHDPIPVAMLRYQIDTIHALSCGYRMLIIRPNHCQLDTNTVTYAFSRSTGNNQLVGTHVHITNLTYHMTLNKATFSAEVRYLTASDGLNAIWMERNNVRIYAWGNEGIRHAVSLTPSVIGSLSATTRLQLTTTVLWDKRVAKAINMSNANWGFSSKLRLEQELPSSMSIVLHGGYDYHNTLDLYSYSGHGGEVGINWAIGLLKQRNLKLKADYTCHFIPDIHITQGAYTGIQHFDPGCTHLVQIHLSYSF